MKANPSVDALASPTGFEPVLSRPNGGMSWYLEQAKGYTRQLNPRNKHWRPQPDLNRCCRRERPVSWTWLDDGDADFAHLLQHL